MQSISDESRSYIHKLTHVLFSVEHTQVFPVIEKSFEKRRSGNECFTEQNTSVEVNFIL
jgi:hypothetical protein